MIFRYSYLRSKRKVWGIWTLSHSADGSKIQFIWNAKAKRSIQILYTKTVNLKSNLAVFKAFCLQYGRPGFDPWVGKVLWRRKWQPTPVLLPGKSHGQRSLVGYSPWGRKELDTTERLHFHFIMDIIGWYIYLFSAAILAMALPEEHYLSL